MIEKPNKIRIDYFLQFIYTVISIVNSAFGLYFYIIYYIYYIIYPQIFYYFINKL